MSVLALLLAAPGLVALEVELLTALIPARDAFEDPLGVAIRLPAGHQICYSTLGRWNPDLLGSAGLRVSAFGGCGASTVHFTEGRFAIGDRFVGAPDKDFVAPEKPFFALVARDFSPVPRTDRRHYAIGSSGWAHINARDDEPRELRFLMNDQYEEHYNNVGELLLIYFIRDSNGLPWDVSYDTFRHGDHLEQSPTAIRDPSGLVYDFEIASYNAYMTKSGRHFSYVIHLHNAGNRHLKGELGLLDDQGYRADIRVDLAPGASNHTSHYLHMAVLETAFVEPRLPDADDDAVAIPWRPVPGPATAEP